MADMAFDTKAVTSLLKSANLDDIKPALDRVQNLVEGRGQRDVMRIFNELVDSYRYVESQKNMDETKSAELLGQLNYIFGELGDVAAQALIDGQNWDIVGEVCAQGEHHFSDAIRKQYDPDFFE